MDVKTSYQIENENNQTQVFKLWEQLPEEMKEVLLDIVLKAQIIQSLDDGYGKIVLNIQRGKVLEIKMMQEKIIKPLKAELV